MSNLPEPLPPTDAAADRWTDARLLGHPAMDAVHREFYEVVAALQACDAHTLPAALAAFEAHARSHFEQEDAWMRESGFPPRDCHIDEHAAVLKSLAEVQQALAAGQAGVALVHDFAAHLLAWFPGHADYLDAALAAWLCKRAHGGVPVVLRRPGR